MKDFVEQLFTFTVPSVSTKFIKSNIELLKVTPILSNIKMVELISLELPVLFGNIRSNTMNIFSLTINLVKIQYNTVQKISFRTLPGSF